MSAGEVARVACKTMSISTTNTPHVVRAFAFRDSQGRQIGACAYRGTETFRDLTAEELEQTHTGWRSWQTVPAGTWFFYVPQSTRNGRAYGASQSRRYFTTEADRDAAALTYLVQAERRAGKVRGAVAVAS